MSNPQRSPELERARRPDAIRRRLRLRFGVPGVVRRTLRKVFELERDWERDQILHRKREAMVRALASARDRTRRKIVGILLPTLADVVDAGWQVMGRRPYQRGHARRPFRCPRSATDLATRRAEWLLNVVLLLGEYEEDLDWVIVHGAELTKNGGASELAWLLAGALDGRDAVADRVFELLRKTVHGEHPTAHMGRHVPLALMACAREDAWQLNEQLLLAAQRQEGLRQSILEAVDESHPEAFRRMLRTILDENLLRFSATIRAVDTWFGFRWDATSAAAVEPLLRRLLELLKQPELVPQTLQGGDAEHIYLALWSLAFDDVERALPAAIEMSRRPQLELRFVATHLLGQFQWRPANAALVERLEDEDLRVATLAFLHVAGDPELRGDPLFRPLRSLLRRTPERPTTLDPLVWPWMALTAKRERISSELARGAEDTDPARLVPLLSELRGPMRAGALRRACGLGDEWDREKKTPPPLSGHLYDTVVGFLGDASAELRNAAFDALESTEVRAAERDRIVSLLHRKSGELRNRCLHRLRRLGDEELLTTAETLLEAKQAPKRAAGLELLRDAIESGRVAERARALVERVAGDVRTGAPLEERVQLEALAAEEEPGSSLDDALGLVDPADLPEVPMPASKPVQLETPAALACVRSLAARVLEEARKDATVPSRGEQLALLDAAFAFPTPADSSPSRSKPKEPPLAGVWQEWMAHRSETERDPDGLELVRALLLLPGGKGLLDGPGAVEFQQPSFHRRFLLRVILQWCVHWERPSGAIEFTLDGLETALAHLTRSDRNRLRGGKVPLWDMKSRHRMRIDEATTWAGASDLCNAILSDQVTRALSVRRFQLRQWCRLDTHGNGPITPTVADAVHALGPEAGAEWSKPAMAQLFDLLVGRHAERRRFRELGEVSGARPPAEVASAPGLLELVDRVRSRIVDIECSRGDRETPASTAALALRTTGGLDTIRAAMRALGRSGFTRSLDASNERSRKSTLSHLVRHSRPESGDTTEVFAEWVADAKLSEKRLLELATYAPQWAGHIGAVLAWPEFESSVWWVHAHNKEILYGWQELESVWAGRVSERTPLRDQDLREGAADVDWFQRSIALLNDDQWQALLRAARYASRAGGHKRALTYAQALRGELDPAELLARIDDKRHQDAVRALGLLPLPEDDSRTGVLLERYERLHRFLRESRRFGAQRRESEKRAVQLGLDNLARRAGFADANRLRWAMEREAVSDLAVGPVTVERDGATIALSIDPEGQPRLAVQSGGKKRKTVPAKLKKDQAVAALLDRRKDLRMQFSRVRTSLEESMVRGEKWSSRELRDLCEHPIVAPSLRQLVLVGDRLRGFPVEGGRALRDADGRIEPIDAEDSLRIAHPVDLLAMGDWPRWQRTCFAEDRKQPFKQVFRELYAPSPAETAEGTRSNRYAGHQVQPRQAIALLGKRGWILRPEEGVSRTDHDAGITARLEFAESFYTPAQVEGLTLEEVIFCRRDEWQPLNLSQVPPRLFSETLRDLDLVVSVAHCGGVDPEASASTMEMRAALVRESSALLKLHQVDVDGSYVHVRGQLAEYSIHLGSAGVRIRGGAAIAIVAVHSQHRGRLFLPFADDDPRSAEVLSKVLLLARDGEIRDPMILEAIRAALG